MIEGCSQPFIAVPTACMKYENEMKLKFFLQAP
jgi:hypothetical protein